MANQAVEQKPPDIDVAEKPALMPSPSECRLALTDAIAIAPTLPPISGPGSCGGDDLVRLEAVVMPDKSRVTLKPAATLRCKMATAVAEWVRGDVAEIAAGLGTKVTELDNFDSYDCRGRNRVFGAKMSEHGRANALDMRGIKLANGKSIALTERDTPREQREKILQSVCGKFSTVLGPGSDGYHEDHVHLDLAERRSNYRICQWAVWDPMPKTAPLMPAVRPDDAPPRESDEERAKRVKEEASQTQTERPAVAPLPQPKPEPKQAAQPQQPPSESALQSSAKAASDAPKTARKQRRARREPSLIESIFQPEPGLKRKKGAGPADAFR